MTPAMIRPFSSIVLFLGVAAAWAQRGPMFQLHRYGPEDGMSNRHVTALLQDNIGFIWAGTVSGLDRFDGHSFRNWSMSDGLSGGRVDALRRDADGLIWVFSTSFTNDIVTVDVIDPMIGVLQPIADRFPELPFDLKDLVRVGPQRADGTLLLGATSPARCIVYQRSGKFKVLLLDGERFEPLGDDATGNIIGHLVKRDGAHQLVSINAAGGLNVLQELEQGTSVEPLTSGRQSAGAFYWTKTSSGSVRYFDTYSEMGFSANRPHTLVLDGDPVRRPFNITPLPERKLVIEDTRVMDEDEQVLFDLKTTHPEIGHSVKDCMLDNSSDPWFATEFGLFQVEVRGDAFERLLYTKDIPEGFGVVCRGMAWHNGKLYLSTEWQGAMVISRQGDSTHFTSKPDPKYLFATYVGKDGTWWRGGPQIVQREDGLGRTRSYPVPDKVWSLLDHVDNGVLMGGIEGLRWLDPASGHVKRWGSVAHPELDHAHVLQLSPCANGDIMATTSKGLYRFSAHGDVLARWWSHADSPMRLPYDDLHHCYVDKEGMFWLSTRGAGLVCFDPATGKYQQYSMRNGFPNNMVYAAYEDDNHQLWLPTDGGIVRFDKRTRQSAVFSAADGITHDEFNRLAHTQADDGRLYFGGLNGITSFDPQDFERSAEATQPPLVLTSFMRYSPEQNGMVDRTVEVARGTGIELGVDDRSILISFALLSFEGDGRIVYAWRLAGLEDDWSYQHDPFVRLDRLPYGTHVLEVKARDANGQWSRHLLQLSITVHMPWYASRMVWVGVGALAAFAMFFFANHLRRRMQRMRRARALAV